MYVVVGYICSLWFCVCRLWTYGYLFVGYGTMSRVSGVRVVSRHQLLQPWSAEHSFRKQMSDLTNWFTGSTNASSLTDWEVSVTDWEVSVTDWEVSVTD